MARTDRRRGSTDPVQAVLGRYRAPVGAGAWVVGVLLPVVLVGIAVLSAPALGDWLQSPTGFAVRAAVHVTFVAVLLSGRLGGARSHLTRTGLVLREGSSTVVLPWSDVAAVLPTRGENGGPAVLTTDGTVHPVWELPDRLVPVLAEALPQLRAQPVGPGGDDADAAFRAPADRVPPVRPAADRARRSP